MKTNKETHLTLPTCNCIIEKRFLFWKYKVVEHDYRLYQISKFMNSSTDFHVHYVCTKCGAKKEAHFVEQDDLILLGIPVKILNSITASSPYYKKWAV